MSESSDLVNPGRDYNQPQTQHTPGPWRATSDGRFIVWDSPRTRHEWLLATLVEPATASASDEVKANARLIAAAPELLEAAREACEYYQSVGGPWERLRIVVAKAEGREP